MGDGTYKVIVSDRADRMLVAHMAFLGRVRKVAAKEKKRELMVAMRSLAHMPQRFPFFNAPYIPANKYHKMFIKNWYQVLYQIQNDTVFIEYILDARTDGGLSSLEN